LVEAIASTHGEWTTLRGLGEAEGAAGRGQTEGTVRRQSLGQGQGNYHGSEHSRLVIVSEGRGRDMWERKKRGYKASKRTVGGQAERQARGAQTIIPAWKAKQASSKGTAKGSGA
jgi:hypothetical protein